MMVMGQIINRFAARMRRNKSWPEKKTLGQDQRRTTGVRFYAQKVILGSHIADFWCPKAKLVIEVDGKQHLKNATGKGCLNEGEETKENKQ